MATPALLDHMRRRGIIVQQQNSRFQDIALYNPLVDGVQGSAPYLPFGTYGENNARSSQEKRIEAADFINANVVLGVLTRNRSNQQGMTTAARDVHQKLLSEKELARIMRRTQPSQYQLTPLRDSRVLDNMRTKRSKRNNGGYSRGPVY